MNSSEENEEVEFDIDLEKDLCLDKNSLYEK